MLRFFDTHAHFEGTDTVSVLDRAMAAGVVRVMAVGGSDRLNTGAVAAAKARPGHVCLALGFDRDQAGLATPDTWCLALRELVVTAGIKLSAVGEIGLDYHYAPETRELQCELFVAQLGLAAEWALPVSIHTREADEDTLRVLDSVAWPHQKPRGIIHCYTGGEAFAEELLSRGFMISFSGIVTFRNADALRRVAAVVPDDRLLVETDSPFLAPVPLRGQTNEPAFVAHTAECVAKQRGCGVSELAELTYQNAVSLLWPQQGGENE